MSKASFRRPRDQEANTESPIEPISKKGRKSSRRSSNGASVSKKHKSSSRAFVEAQKKAMEGEEIPKRVGKSDSVPAVPPSVPEASAPAVDAPAAPPSVPDASAHSPDAPASPPSVSDAPASPAIPPTVPKAAAAPSSVLDVPAAAAHSPDVPDLLVIINKLISDNEEMKNAIQSIQSRLEEKDREIQSLKDQIRLLNERLDHQQPPAVVVKPKQQQRVVVGAGGANANAGVNNKVKELLCRQMNIEYDPRMGPIQFIKYIVRIWQKRDEEAALRLQYTNTETPKDLQPQQLIAPIPEKIGLQSSIRVNGNLFEELDVLPLTILCQAMTYGQQSNVVDQGICPFDQDNLFITGYDDLVKYQYIWSIQIPNQGVLEVKWVSYLVKIEQGNYDAVANDDEIHPFACNQIDIPSNSWTCKHELNGSYHGLKQLLSLILNLITKLTAPAPATAAAAPATPKGLKDLISIRFQEFDHHPTCSEEEDKLTSILEFFPYMPEVQTGYNVMRTALYRYRDCDTLSNTQLDTIRRNFFAYYRYVRHDCIPFSTEKGHGDDEDADHPLVLLVDGHCLESDQDINPNTRLTRMLYTRHCNVICDNKQRVCFILNGTRVASIRRSAPNDPLGGFATFTNTIGAPDKTNCRLVIPPPPEDGGSSQLIYLESRDDRIKSQRPLEFVTTGLVGIQTRIPKILSDFNTVSHILQGYIKSTSSLPPPLSSSSNGDDDDVVMFH